MEKLNRFLAKHHIPIYVICSVLWIALYLLTVEHLMLLAVILVCGCIILTARWLGSRWLVLLKKPMDTLDNQCDP